MLGDVMMKDSAVSRKSFSRRAIALLLAALLCFWCVPAAAFAAGEGESGDNPPSAGSSISDNTADPESSGDPTNPADPANPANPDNTANPPDEQADEQSGGQAGGQAGTQTDTQADAQADAPADGAIAPTVEGSLPDGADDLANDPLLGREPAVIEPGLYKIIAGVGQWKVLDVRNGATSNGTSVQIYSSNNTLAQFFDIQPAETEGYYTLRALNSGKNLDLDAGGMDPGTRVQIWNPANTPNQEWAFYDNGLGGYTVISRTNHLALDVRGANPSNGTQVQTYTPNGTDAQNFTLKPVETLIGEGIYSISPRYTSKVLDVNGASGSAGANVQLWGWNDTLAQRFLVKPTDTPNEFTVEAVCSGLLLTQTGRNVDQQPATGASNQIWHVQPAVSGGFAFINKESGLALDISGASQSDGANAQVYEPNGTAAQAYDLTKIAPVGNGTYVIKSVACGRVFDVAGGSEANGANVRAWESNDTGAQKWVFRAQDDNGTTYSILNAASNKALDVTGANGTAGVNIQQWEAGSGNVAQLWKVVYVGGGDFQIYSILGAGNLAAAIVGDGSQNGANIALCAPGESSDMTYRLQPTTYIPPIPASWLAMNDRVANIASSTNYLLAVDETNCIVGVYQGSRGAWTRLATWPCSPGAWGTPTVKGIFRIQSRGYSFGTSSYTCYYWTQFYGNYLFHSVLYYPGSSSVKDGRLGMRLSHGCVRLAIENAQWINSNIPTGTTVVSY